MRHCPDNEFLRAAYRKQRESSPVSPIGKQSEEVEEEELGEKYIGNLRVKHSVRTPFPSFCKLLC
jgi:hypothetical protein